MKEIRITLPGILTLLALLMAAASVKSQQSLSGTYVLQSGDVTLNLTLTQQGNSLGGTLSGSTGASFTISGEVENGLGYGTCSGAEGAVYFSALIEGQTLTFSLIEPDAYGAPDYEQVQYLTFQKSGSQQGGNAGAVTGALGLSSQNNQNQQYQARPNQAQQFQNQQNQGQPNQAQQFNASASTGASGTATITANEVGDPAWGIKFGLPQGWVKRQDMQGAIVGHNTIAGMVLVMPHMSRNLQEMQQEMMQGIQDETTSLTPSASLQQLSRNVLTGDFAGYSQGTQIKAKGYGILSPNGGGAYLIAVTTPDKLGPELLGAAEHMLNSVRYFRVEVGDLMQHFAGTWQRHTQHTGTYLSFYPDGTYSDQTDISAAGDFHDAGGNWTGGWSAMGEDKGQGSWTVRGDKDQGVIIVKMNNGDEYTYEYRVHVEDGHKYYNEYYFNGEFYYRKK